MIIVTELKRGQHCAVSPCSSHLFYYFLLEVKALENNAQATGDNTDDIYISVQRVQLVTKTILLN